MGPLQGLEPAKERASRKRGAFLASWRVRRQAGEAGADPRSGYADVLSPAPLIERAPSNGSFFVMACFFADLAYRFRTAEARVGKKCQI